MSKLDILDITKVPLCDCKGLFFRYTESSYLSKRNTLEYKQSFRLLKKKSCDGCDQCRGFWEDLGMSSIEEVVELPEGLIDNYVYRVQFEEMGRDWETGLVDDWVWTFVAVEDNWGKSLLKEQEE